jgi:hypothetical protein
VFVGSGGALTAVIKKNDVLFDSAVSSLRFDKFGLDLGGSGNVAFSYTLVNGKSGVALAIAGGPPLGDYDRNGTVDTADYVLWRDTLGQIVAEGTGADGNFSGNVDNNDYFIWKARFGQQAEPGAGSTISHISDVANVPEPSARGLMSCFTVSVLLFWRRTRCSQPL